MIILSVRDDLAQFLDTLQLVTVGEQEARLSNLLCVPSIRIAEMVANGAPTPEESDEDWWVIRTPDGQSVYVTEYKEDEAA